MGVSRVQSFRLQTALALQFVFWLVRAKEVAVLKYWRRPVFVGLCFFVASNCFGQLLSKENRTALKGCLTGGPDETYLRVDYDHVYRLVGHTSGFTKLLATGSKEVSLEGVEDHSSLEDIEKYPSEPQLTFRITKVVRTFERPKPQLSRSFGDLSSWRTEKNPANGVQFQHPSSLPVVPASETGAEEFNFVAKEGAVSLGSFEIPREIYRDTNFVGGRFTISVNPTITSLDSCDQFEGSDPENLSSQMIDGVRYTGVSIFGAASNTNYEKHYFHTMQNTQCYELVVELAYFNTGVMGDGGCTIPEVQDSDKSKLVEPILGGVSFFRPTFKTADDLPH